MSYRNTLFSCSCLAAALLAALSAPLVAAEDAPRRDVVMPRVDVIGSVDDLPQIAGSAEMLDEQTLQTGRVFTANEALRKVPGIHVRDEEGFGLRPNIGVRGLNPTRSTKVTLLEDGVPLAYAPYGDNASYYHPPIDRYERVEILKGAEQILFGPQTIGAVINYITPTPPQQFGGSVAATLGSRDYLNARARVGGDGMLFDIMRKEGEGARDNMNHELNDVNVKKVMRLGGSQALTLRANAYSEDSQLTYSGLTEAEFRNFGPRYNPFKNDSFETERYGASATHEVDLGQNRLLTTNIYYANFNRDWWRQSSTTTDSQCGGAFTTDRLAGVAVDPDACNSAQGRLRKYYTYGVEPRLKLGHNVFGIASELETGVKVHWEEQKRLQVNGTSPTARSGTTVEDNLRETKAYSAFALNRFLVGDWTIAPGVRYEYVDSSRTNNLNGVTGSDTLDRVLPALGLTWNPSKTLTVFAGVHRGFAPPRTEDIIGGTGTATDVGPEDSVNWELGLRSRPEANTHVQATLFRNDFKRLIAVGSIAGGSTPLAEGEALFQGVEASGRYAMTNGVYVSGAYTYLQKAEQTTPYRQVSNGAVVTGSAVGNRQPYAPEHTLTAAVGFARGPFDVQLEGVYVDEQYTDFANTAQAAPNGNGQTGKLDDYLIWNAALNYRLQKNLTLYTAVKNVADEVYIVDRTRGIQVGMPRLIQAGASYNF